MGSTTKSPAHTAPACLWNKHMSHAHLTIISSCFSHCSASTVLQLPAPMSSIQAELLSSALSHACLRGSSITTCPVCAGHPRRLCFGIHQSNMSISPWAARRWGKVQTASNVPAEALFSLPALTIRPTASCLDRLDYLRDPPNSFYGMQYTFTWTGPSPMSDFLRTSHDDELRPMIHDVQQPA